MDKDFLELFSHLNTQEVYEPDMYGLVEEIHSLIRYNIKKSIPNAVRRFYECFLYRCQAESEVFELIYHKDKERSGVNIPRTSRALFKNDMEYYKKNVQKFISPLNNGSHWISDTDTTEYTYDEIYTSDRNKPAFKKRKDRFERPGYAALKSNDQRTYVNMLINLWNWYAKNIRNLDEKYLITDTYSLPKPFNKILEDTQNELASRKDQIQDLKTKLEKYEEEDQPIDADSLGKDIYNTIKLFNENHIYCTHKAVAFFLLGTRIAQTEFCKLDRYEDFGKYSRNKFSEFEYDLAIQTLISQEQIVQDDVYFRIWDKNANIFVKLYKRLTMILSRPKSTRQNINQKYVIALQKAITSHQKVRVKYTKTDRATNKSVTSVKILTPVIMVPKESMNVLEQLRESFNKDNPAEIYKESEKFNFTENLYYLGAIDDEEKKSDEIRTYRLDGIRKVKII
ncbi:MAG: hypothetical protein K6E29_07060 [Cyanobacteria bacterium RUI128]|nr:hypothetical protein [Cyanobacteria bacterium RUI128]